MRPLETAGRFVIIALPGTFGAMMMVAAADPGPGGDWPLSQLLLTSAVWIGVTVAVPYAIALLRRRALRRRDVTAEEPDLAARRRTQLIGGLSAAGAILLCWPLIPVITSSAVLVLVCGWLLGAIAGVLTYAHAKGLWDKGIGPLW